MYTYDGLGQVTSGKRYWNDGTPVAGQQFQYGFDDIGNRKSTASGGDQFGSNLRYATYGANLLNQYTNRTIPSYLDIQGEAKTNATVTIWNSDGTYAQTYRKGDFYRGELQVTNSTFPLLLTVTNLAVLKNGTSADIITNTVGTQLLAKTPEQFTYDADGNLTSDGAWTNTWDAANRLVSVQSLASVPATARKKLDFTYDCFGRRIQKIVSTWSGSVYSPESTNRFIYDGWNLIAILNETNAPLASFAWGLDLSGTTRGAGGVGGLLSMTVYQGSNAGTYFYSYDGNGNAVALSSAADGSITAQYEYGVFGEPLRATGPAAMVNPFRFSTTFYDFETGLNYFGYRYYNPSSGKWLTRDPLGESAGRQLYNFVWNSSPNLVDRLGLDPMGNPVSGPNGPVGPSTMGGINYWYYTPPISQQTRRILYRVSASMQCIGGAIEAVSGAALATGGAGLEVGTGGASTPASVPAMTFGGAFFVNGIDNAFTGYKKAIYLYDYKTATEQTLSWGISKLGVPKAEADRIAANINGAGLLVGGGVTPAFKMLCCSKSELAITVEVAVNTGLADLAQFRQELGPIPGGGLPDGGTLARLDIGGNSYYGINAHGTEITLNVNAITETHAEADAFQQAANAGITGDSATLYIDRELCGACGQNGGVNSMASQLGIKQLTIVTPSGSVVIPVH